MSGLCGLLQFGECGISVVKVSSMDLSIYLHAGVGTESCNARCLGLWTFTGTVLCKPMYYRGACLVPYRMGYDTHTKL